MTILNPIEILRNEHELVLKILDKLEDSLNDKNLEQSKMEIKLLEIMEEIGSHIIFLLRKHINKKNNILFMMADMHLDDKQKESILEKFTEIESQSK